MSEHDEPKTALTRLLGEHLPSFQSDGDYGERQWVECTCDSDYFVDTDAGYEEHRAHLADVLLAEGYTTSPAPEATEAVEWEYGVDYTHMVGTRASNGWTAGYTSRAHADQIAAERLDGKVFRRRATGPWVPVDRATDEHEEDS